MGESGPVELDKKPVIFTGSARPQTLAERLKQIESSPDVFTRVTDLEIQNLSSDEYALFLNLINRTCSATEIAKHIDVISDRFTRDITALSDAPYPKRSLAHDIGEETRMSLWLLAGDSDIRLSREVIERFYGYVFHPNRQVRFHASQYVDNLMYLDNRNKTPGEHVGIYERYKNDLVNFLSNPKATPEDYESGLWLIDLAWASFPGELPSLFVTSMKQATEATTIRQIFRFFANRLGMEESRKLLRTSAQKDSNFAKQFERIEKALALTPGEKALADLHALYEKIKFEEYKPNEALLAYETELIVQKLPQSGLVLDIGMGTGRHLTKLTEKGMHVTGFDFVRRHAQVAKQANPESQVAVADWHALPFANGSFDAAYCLGRTFLHNTTVDDMINFLGEARRILRGNNSRLIMDLPNDRKGHYRWERERLAQQAQHLGIEYKEAGAIIDSPDAKNFFDRLVPTAKQFRAIAALSGFDAQVIAERQFGDVEGYSNTNTYWQLTPQNKPLDTDQLLKAISEARTAGPPLFVTWL